VHSKGTTVTIEIIEGDCREVLKELPDQSVNCIVTSPPYFGLRDYGVENQMGLEPTPAEFVEALVGVLREARRVLRDDGTLWLNLGDSYAGAGYSNHANTGGDQRSDGGKQTHMTGSGLKNKDLIGIPWRVAFALQADGWYLRQDIIWHKPNPMPESVRDRCTKAHEYIFLLSKSPTYYFDHMAIRTPLAASSVARLSQPNLENQEGSDRVPGKTNGKMKAVRFGGNKYGDDDREESRTKSGNEWKESTGANKRSVWSVSTKPFKEAHFATFPPDLIEPCVLAGCPEGGTVLDPFFGAGTTGLVCQRTNRNCIGIELNPEYYDIAAKRLWPEEATQAAE
jgi:DNA modification methylase